ncbi:MAG: 3-deoxy-D-manno-octulosonic acid transferase [Pseudomonadota bacterium]
MTTETEQLTVLLAHADTLAGTEPFLNRLQKERGPLLLVTPDGRGPAGFTTRRPPWLGRGRWLARLKAALFIRVGDAPRWPLPDSAPHVWINAPSGADTAGMAAVFRADDGDPLLALPPVPPLPEANPLCERFAELREAGRWILYFPATVEDEEPMAYGVFFELLRRRKGFMALAPADAERYEPVYREALKYRLPTNRHNRLSTSWIPKKSRVYYVEDRETLDGLHDCADVVVPGGTLVGDARRPDLFTPLARGVAVVVGPARRDDPVVAAALAAGAVRPAADENDLVEVLLPLLGDAETCRQQASRGREWLECHGGAAERILRELPQKAAR